MEIQFFLVVNLLHFSPEERLQPQTFAPLIPPTALRLWAPPVSARLLLHYLPFGVATSGHWFGAATSPPASWRRSWAFMEQVTGFPGAGPGHLWSRSPAFLAQVRFFVGDLRRKSFLCGLWWRKSPTFFRTCAKQEWTCAKQEWTCAKKEGGLRQARMDLRQARMDLRQKGWRLEPGRLGTCIAPYRPCNRLGLPAKKIERLQAFDFQLLDFVGVVLAGHKDRDDECFAAGLEVA